MMNLREAQSISQQIWPKNWFFPPPCLFFFKEASHGITIPDNKAPGKHRKPFFWKRRKTLEKNHRSCHFRSCISLTLSEQQYKINFISKDCNATLLNLNSHFFFSKESFKKHFGTTTYVKQISAWSNGQICTRILYRMKMWCQNFNLPQLFYPEFTMLCGSCNMIDLGWFPLSMTVMKEAHSLKSCFVCFGLIILSCWSVTLLPKMD